MAHHWKRQLRHYKLAFLTYIFEKVLKMNATSTIERPYGRIVKQRLQKLINTEEEQSVFTIGGLFLGILFCIEQKSSKQLK